MGQYTAEMASIYRDALSIDQTITLDEGMEIKPGNQDSVTLYICGDEFRKLPRESITADFLNEMGYYLTANLSQDVNEWEYIRSSKYLRLWETPYLGETVYITGTDSFSVHAPVRYEDGYAGHSSELRTALVRAGRYMSEHTPWEIDYAVTKRDILTEELQQVNGVGKATATEVLSIGAQSYTEVLERVEHLQDIGGASHIKDESLENLQGMLENKVESDLQLSEHPDLLDIVSECGLKSL